MSNNNDQDQRPRVETLPDRRLPPLRLVGLSIRTNNAEAPRTIPALWERARSRGWQEAVPDAVPWEGAEVPMVGLYSDYESDHNGPFTLTVGVPVAAGAAVPADMVLREVPALTYAHVKAEGPLVPAVMAAWQHVWGTLTPRRSFQTDLEVFRGSGDQGRPIDLFVAVR